MILHAAIIFTRVLFLAFPLILSRLLPISAGPVERGPSVGQTRPLAAACARSASPAHAGGHDAAPAFEAAVAVHTCARVSRSAATEPMARVLEVDVEPSSMDEQAVAADSSLDDDAIIDIHAPERGSLTALIAGAAPAPTPRRRAGVAAAPPRNRQGPSGRVSVRAGDGGASLAAESQLTHDGAFWTETVTGLQTIDPAGRVRISTRGAVTVHGVSQSGVRYSLLKRVKARTENQARRLMEQYQVRAEREGDLTTLKIAHAGEDGQTAELKVNVPRSLREVIVETHGGPVSASDLDGAVRAETGGGRMIMDRIGGRLAASTAGGTITLGSVRGGIACTSAGGSISAESIGGEAVVETGGGDITVGNVRGTLRASTAGGGIKIRLAGSSVVATTAGGAIDVGRARGSVTANNLGGPIQIGAADGVNCETAGGTIRLSNISGSLRAATAVGSIYATLTRGQPMGDSFLSTSAGDITVVVPDGFPLTIRAENASADSVRRILSDFPAIRVRTAGPLAVAEGKILGGGPILKLTGTGGTIRIQRQVKQDTQDQKDD